MRSSDDEPAAVPETALRSIPLSGAAAAAAALLAPAPAFAGAWMAEGSQTIWTTAFGETELDGTYSESSLYYETGLGARTAFVATPWLRQGGEADEDGWRGEAVAGVKLELAQGEHGAMAVQAGALWRSETEEGCGEGGAEARWMGGVSYGPEGRGFLNLETAARVQQGGCAGERVEVTAGYRPNDRWLVMGQVFVDDARYDEQRVLAQMSLVRFGDSGRGLQVGFRSRLDGEDREAALVIGLWGRPER